MTAYLTLFTAALLAATILPAQSEAVLVTLLLARDHPVSALLAVATAGNVSGAVINWGVGRCLLHPAVRRRMPFSDASLVHAQARYHRFGRWSLLASWVPLIGDPLTVVAGIMREPFWSFLILVTLAKGLRYVVLAGMTLAWMG